MPDSSRCVTVEGPPAPGRHDERPIMPSWLIILILGVVLLILGFSGVAKFLIWVGVAVLVVSLVLALLGRARSGTR